MRQTWWWTSACCVGLWGACCLGVVRGSAEPPSPPEPPAAPTAADPTDSKEQPSGSDRLVELIRAHRDKFRPPTPEMLEQKRARVLAAADRFDAFLATGGRALRDGWHEYLHWDILTHQLAQDTPDLQELNKTLQQLYTDVPGNEKAPALELRRELHEYMNMVLVARTPAMSAQYRAQLDALAAAVTAYRKDPQNDQAVAIGRILGWLSDASQAPDVVAAVRKEFGHPNLEARVSRRLVAVGTERPVDQSTVLTDNILGTSLRGVARLQGQTRMRLQPSDDSITIDIQLTGTAISNNTGTNRGVVIYSSATTAVEATKRVTIDAYGIHLEPAQARCETHSTIDSICHRLRLVRKIAWKKAQQQHPEAEAIANCRAERRVERQVDEEARKMLEEPSRNFEEKFRNPLVRKNEFPAVFRLASTADEIRAAWLQANPTQVGAPAAAPLPEGDFDLVFALHESFAGNFSEAVIGGYKLTDERLVQILEENKQEVPDELKIAPDKDPWSITFARLQPVRLEVRDQKLKITIRGREFSRGEQVVAADMDIWAVYQLQRTPQGVTLVREGEVQAEYARGGFENAAKIAVKTLMRKKFDALFKPELAGEGLKLPGEWSRGGTLKLAYLDAANGWLAMAWRLPPDPATTARAD